jgi:hypothetical protein
MITIRASLNETLPASGKFGGIGMPGNISTLSLSPTDYNIHITRLRKIDNLNMLITACPLFNLTDSIPYNPSVKSASVHSDRCDEKPREFA